jgi:LacI family transcriptional regulator
VIIDHDVAAEQALTHLRDNGHRRIAFLKGNVHNTDTADRWRAISEAAQRVGLEIRSELVKEIGGPVGEDLFSPERRYRTGFEIGRELLAAGSPFTALFTFNDVSAIGAIRAFLDAGLAVPEDVSVIGFDDIPSARFQNPSLTTIHQPLREMGELAAKTLLDRLSGAPREDFLTVEPNLVVRGSSGPAPSPERA